MQKTINDLIKMNINGQVLELHNKYFDENILMLNNGVIFATSRNESYEKQKEFIESLKEFNVKLLSSKINENISELVFHYKMTGVDSLTNEFSGKHIQTWENGKIIKEEYFIIE